MITSRTTPSPLASGSDSKYGRLLINISSGIGDAIMAEPMIRTIHAAYPGIRIHILASSSTKILFEFHPYVEKVFVIEPRIIRILQLIWGLRSQKYDAYIGAIPSNTLSKVLVPFSALIPYKIKHQTPHSGWRNLDFLFQRIEPIPEGRHRIECNLDLLKHVGFPPHEAKIQTNIVVPEKSSVRAERMLKEKGYNPNKITIGFHPGCNPQAAFKRWAPEKYAELINYLDEKRNAQIIIVGGKDEEEDVQKIGSLLSHQPYNFVGQADLLETAALIKHCRIFISNDSGIMHLATAVDIPVFAIFGPKDERHIGPYGHKHTVIRNGKDVNNVTVEQVIDTLLKSEHGLMEIKQ